MQNPNELRAQAAEKLALAQSIDAAAQASKRDVTAEERAIQDGLLDEADALKCKATEIEAAEKAAQQRTLRMSAMADDFTQSAGRRTAPTQPTAGIEVKAPEFIHDKMRGFASPREYFGLLVRAENGDIRAIEDPRMQYLATAGTDEQQGGSSPYGGFLLPEAMEPGVKSRDVEADPFVGRTTPLTMNALTVKVNALVDANHTTSVSGGLTVSRSSETASKTASRFQLEQVKFEANSEFGFAYSTEELLRDSPGTVASLLSVGFAREFQANHVKELLRGTGVGQREGVQTSPALVTISKEISQVADTITYANIIKMYARCYGRGDAIWLYNHDAFPQLAQLSQVVGTGGVPMWMFSAVEGAPNRLLGLPAFASEYMETVGDLHDIMLIAPRAIWEGTYQPLESAESMHVRFDRHERAFKFWQRNDARSLWRAPLTPNKGGNTLSPFVTLAARA